MASLQAPIIRFNMASCKIEKWKWKASKHQLTISTWPVANLKSESEKPSSTIYLFQHGQLQNWKVKVKRLQAPIIHFNLASCKIESEKHSSTNHPLQFGLLQRKVKVKSLNTLIIHFNMANLKNENGGLQAPIIYFKPSVTSPTAQVCFFSCR